MLGLLYQIEATTNVVKKNELLNIVDTTALDYFRKTPMLINWVGCIDKIEVKNGNEIELEISANIFGHTVNFVNPGIKPTENIKLYEKIRANRIYEGQLVKFRANVMDIRSFFSQKTQEAIYLLSSKEQNTIDMRVHHSKKEGFVLTSPTNSNIKVKFLDIDKNQPSI